MNEDDNQHAETDSRAGAKESIKHHSYGSRIRQSIRRTSFWNKAIVFLTALLVVSNSLYTYYSRKQWRVANQTLQEIRKGSSDTHNLATAAGTQADRTKDLADQMKLQAVRAKDIADQAVIQAEAGKRLAQNAVDTLRNSQKSFRDEQRAWIGILEATTLDFAETKPWTVAIIFFNSGKTPARNVQVSQKYKLSEIPISGPSLEDIKGLTFRPAQSIAPQSRFNHVLGYIAAGEGHTPSELLGTANIASRFNDIKAGKVFVYYFGILKYEDVFGNSRETQYCIFLANPDTKQSAFCDAFNDLN